MTDKSKNLKEAERLERERRKNLKLLESSYLMYENTLKTYENSAREKKGIDGSPLYSEEKIEETKELLENMQKDIIEQYVQGGGKKEDLENLKKETSDNNKRDLLKNLMNRESQKDEMREYFEKISKNEIVSAEKAKGVELQYKQYDNIKEVLKEETKNKIQEKSLEEERKRVLFQETVVDKNTNPIDRMKTKQMYDIVKLPSKGQCYKTKKDSIKVAYLTAYDENMILSPNLYKDGSFLDFLLHNKVLDDEISPDNLVQGDRDAIIIWLRATGYGTEYPIVVADEYSGKEFETSVDLSEIKYKPFKLKGDENGYFSFTMPETGDLIKFRYLTQANLKHLQKIKETESKKLNVARLKQYTSDMLEMIKDNDLISSDAKLKVKSATSTVLDEINKNYDENSDLSFSHELTDKLIMQTVSVNNIKDYDYIKNYILTMNVKDAKAYREYMRDNEPGIDYKITVERPLSLGGGSITTFLQLDQFIFVTV